MISISPFQELSFIMGVTTILYVEIIMDGVIEKTTFSFTTKEVN